MTSVAIVAMGRSHADYCMEAAVENSRYRLADEIWAINAMGHVIQHDRLYVMDDLRVFVKRMEGTKPWYTEWMQTHDRPIYTSVDYSEFPASVEYPLQTVVQELQNPYYFNSTVAYALAHAIAEKRFNAISLYGCDFSYDDAHQSEAGRGCVEFLLGIAHARGIAINLAHNTTLMDQNVPVEHRFYGYIKQPHVTAQQDGQYAVQMAGGVEYNDIGPIDFVYGRYALRKKE